MSSATSPSFDTELLTAMSKRVLIGDGAMGTMLQAADLTLDDFLGLVAGHGLVEVVVGLGHPHSLRVVTRLAVRPGLLAVHVTIE